MHLCCYDIEISMETSRSVILLLLFEQFSQTILHTNSNILYPYRLSVLQDMTSAVITYCGHYFHGNCLRKWLYVQETCPMCHTPIKPSTSNPNPAAGDAQSNPPQTQPHPPQQEPATEHTDTHQAEQGPVEHVVHSPDKTSESEAPPRTKGLQNLNCSASGDTSGPGCSLEGNPCNERNWESGQRTN